MNASLPVYDKDRRNLTDAVIEGKRAVAAKVVLGPRDLVRFYVVEQRLPSALRLWLIEADSDKLDSAILEGLVDLFHARHGFNTRRAPGSPEIDDDDLSTQRFVCYSAARDLVFERKVERFVQIAHEAEHVFAKRSFL